MKKYDIEYQFVSRSGDDDEYTNEIHILLAASVKTLNRLKNLFWVKILKVKEIEI